MRLELVVTIGIINLGRMCCRPHKREWRIRAINKWACAGLKFENEFCFPLYYPRGLELLSSEIRCRRSLDYETNFKYLGKPRVKSVGGNLERVAELPELREAALFSDVCFPVMQMCTHCDDIVRLLPARSLQQLSLSNI